jgi:DNA repair protein RecO
MSIVKTNAIVLKTDNYRHTSKLVTLFSEEYGKIKCIAKGVRDVKSRWGSVLQPMAYISTVLYFKNNTLHLLSNADYIRHFSSNYQDFEKIRNGLKMLELVTITCDFNQKNENVFHLLLSFLKLLDEVTFGYNNLLFAFKSRMAELLGFKIDTAALKYRNNPGSEFVMDRTDLQYGRMKLADYNVNIVETLIKGNFNDILSLNISDESTEVIEKFFNDYYCLHYEDIKFKVKRV